MFDKKPLERIGSPYNVGPINSEMLSATTQALPSLYHPMKFKKNECHGFIKKEETGLYIVTSGLLKLEMISPLPRIIRLVTPGDMVGYGMWRLLDTSPYILTAIVESEVQFWSAKSVEKISAQNPQFNQFVIEHLLHHILHKDERIVILESQVAEERVIRILHWLSQKFGVMKGEEVLINISLDRNSLAQLAGTTPETFSRTITSLEERNLVRRKRKSLLIPNFNQFEKHLNTITNK